ncbi:hypothetical protein BDF14DRAFT_1873469 [Spinellus fusiger]|nr:hypothetical protein BDF14DRAFT_1873469 [Spinellus fusiger]
MILEAEPPLTAYELQVLQRQYEKEGKSVQVQTKFNYAWGLVRSKAEEHLQLALVLFKDIDREFPDRKRECLYYLALGNYKLSNFNEARHYNSQLLELEMRNEQAQELGRLIDDKVSREGAIGLAILSGMVALGAIAMGLLRKK